MKSFKKALAVLLAVLMVAFSVPFTAFADAAPVLKMYVYDFDSKASWGYGANSLDDDNETIPTYDPTAVAKEDISSSKGVVAVVFAFENLNEDFFSGALTLNWDTNKVIPAYYSSKTAVKTGNAIGVDNFMLANVTLANGDASALGTAFPFNDMDAIQVAFHITAASEAATAVDATDITEEEAPTYAGGTVPGTVVAVLGFQLQEDTVDLTEAITVNTNTDWTYLKMNSSDTADQLIVCEGATSSNPTFSIPQWTGGEEPPAPQKDTYTFIDGSTTEVDAGADAPANTASTAWADNGNGTHSRTVYSWNGFTEVGTTETANCDSNTVVTPAQTYVHTKDSLVDGITAVTKCSVCGGNQQGGETTVAEHTYVPAVTAATCQAQGYTTYTCECGATYVDDYTDIDPTNHEGQIVDDEAVAATCQDTGLTAGSHYDCCGAVVVAQTITDIDPDNHTGQIVDDDAVAATCITDGKTAGSHYDCCGAVVVAQETIPASADYHNYEVESSTGATCTQAGSVTYKCSICGDEYTEDGATDPTNHTGQIVTDEAVAATCVAGGKTAGSHYDCCGAVVVAQEDTPVDPTNHVGTTHTENAAAATCTAVGYTGDEVCDSCGNVVTAGTEIAIDPTAHTGQIVDDEAVAATKSTTGLTAGSHYDCCGAVVVAQEVVPALGVNITVDGDTAAVKVNDEAYTGTVNVAYGSKYTLSTDADNFEAWMVGGKIVSTSATYTTAAFADTTYTAVFADETATAKTITFVDKFNNVLGTFTTDDAKDWTTLDGVVVSPFDAFVITGFDKSLADVQGATEDITVTATYEAVVQTYTVTAAAGVTITVDDVVVDSPAQVAYDTKVTVSADDASAWTVNGKEAGFGNSYSFYVTSDVEVAFTTAVVEATPVVTPVSMDLQSDGTKVRFLASRSVPANYKVVESGFVYGKEMAENDLVLENVGTAQGAAGATVKLYKNSNVANEGQFGMTYGVSAHTIASARAYLIVSLDGVVQPVIYADAQIYNY